MERLPDVNAALQLGVSLRPKGVIVKGVTGSNEKEVGSLTQALEELRKTFQVEEEIKKTKELQIKAIVTLSKVETLQARMKVSLAEGLKAVIVKGNNDKMLEVEDALLLQAIIPGAMGLLRLKAALEVTKPLLKIVCSKATTVKGPRLPLPKRRTSLPRDRQPRAQRK
ncbi:hypothetical protein ACLOJK_003974 [Asimina triloba]